LIAVVVETDSFHAATVAVEVFRPQSASALFDWLNHMRAKIRGNFTGRAAKVSLIQAALSPPCSEQENSGMKSGLSIAAKAA